MIESAKLWGERAIRTSCGNFRAFTIVAAALGGCATAPNEPVSERLDPVTATTVMVISRPVELLSNGGLNRATKDPFAYLAPFETDRMGERTLFLWVSAPEAPGMSSRPQVLCNGEPIPLQPLGNDGPPGPPTSVDAGRASAAASIDPAELSRLNLSRPPYPAPVPWNAQWYFRLPADGLKCLAAANAIALEMPTPQGGAEQFTADRKSLGAMGAFARRTDGTRQ